MSIVGGYLVLWGSNASSSFFIKPICFFKKVTGIPCPGCGMGRATIELFKGKIFSSFDFNILCIPFTITVLIVLCLLIVDLAKREELVFRCLYFEFKTPYKQILLVVIITNWIVNIIRAV